MGDDISSVSVTGCRLRSLGNHRQHTEMHYIRWLRKNQNNQNLNQCHHPLITQLSLKYRFNLISLEISYEYHKTSRHLMILIGRSLEEHRLMRLMKAQCKRHPVATI